MGNKTYISDKPQPDYINGIGRNKRAGYTDIIHTPYSAEAQKPCAPAGGNLEGGECQYEI